MDYRVLPNELVILFTCIKGQVEQLHWYQRFVAFELHFDIRYSNYLTHTEIYLFNHLTPIYIYLFIQLSNVDVDLIMMISPQKRPNLKPTPISERF